MSDVMSLDIETRGAMRHNYKKKEKGEALYEAKYMGLDVKEYVNDGKRNSPAAPTGARCVLRCVTKEGSYRPKIINKVLVDAQFELKGHGDRKMYGSVVINGAGGADPKRAYTSPKGNQTGCRENKKQRRWKWEELSASRTEREENGLGRAETCRGSRLELQQAILTLMLRSGKV